APELRLRRVTGRVAALGGIGKLRSGSKHVTVSVHGPLRRYEPGAMGRGMKRQPVPIHGEGAGRRARAPGAIAGANALLWTHSRRASSWVFSRGKTRRAFVSKIRCFSAAGMESASM